jgi:predicted kinase
MKPPHKTPDESNIYCDIDVVRGFDNTSYCAARCLKDGRVVLGDGRSPAEAVSLCKYESIKVLESH